MIRGFDASSVQGVIDYGSLPAELSFVILKAQQGNDGFDPCFEANMRGALKYKIAVFAYVFAYPLPNRGPMTSGYLYGRDPREQAKLCVDRVHRFHEMRGRPLFLDLEWPAPEDWKKWGITAATISEWCSVFCEEVALLSGSQPVLYTYPWWWQALSVADVSWAARYALWLAAYVTGWPKDGDRPRVPRPWDTWLFWQFDGNGGLRLPNGTDADFCVFNGDEDALRALATPATVPSMQAANDNAPVVIEGGTVHPALYRDDGPPDAA